MGNLCARHADNDVVEKSAGPKVPPQGKKTHETAAPPPPPPYALEGDAPSPPPLTGPVLPERHITVALNSSSRVAAKGTAGRASETGGSSTRLQPIITETSALERMVLAQKQKTKQQHQHEHEHPARAEVFSFASQGRPGPPPPSLPFNSAATVEREPSGGSSPHRPPPALSLQGIEPQAYHPAFAHFRGVFPSGAGITSMAPVPCDCHSRSASSTGDGGAEDHAAGCVLVGAGDGSVALVHCGTGHIRQRWTEAHERDVIAIAPPLARTRQFLTASRDRALKLWQLDPQAPSSGPSAEQSFGVPVASALPLATCVGHSLSVTCADTHPTQPWAVSGSRDNTVRLWDLERGGTEVHRGDIKLNLVHFVKFLPDMSCVVQGGEDRTIRVWDIRVGAARAALSLSNTLEGMDYFATCALSFATLQQQLGTARGPGQRRRRSSGVTTDGSDTESETSISSPCHLVTGHHGANGCGAYVKEWDLRSTGREICTHAGGHHHRVIGLSPVDLGSSVGFLSCSADSVLRYWNTAGDHQHVPRLASAAAGARSAGATASAAVTITEGRTSCFTSLCLPCTSESPFPQQAVAVGLDTGGIVVLSHGPDAGEARSGVRGVPTKRFRYFGDMHTP